MNVNTEDSNSQYLGSDSANRARADEHFPRTVNELRQAAIQMLRDGHGEHSIAAALRMDVVAVRQLLGGLCVECGA